MATNTTTEKSKPAGGAAPGGAGDGDRNSLQQARPRQRKSQPRRSAPEEGTSVARPARQVNSISAPRARASTPGDRPATDKPSEVKDQQARLTRSEPKESAGTAPSVAEDHQTVPEHVRRRFVQVGRKYYFPDGARAFTDRGRRLTTPSENTEVIRSLVTIAHARGWREIVVRGTDSFRREAWFAAQLMGLEVRGYRPTDFEQARLVRTLANRQPGAEERADPKPQANTPAQSGRRGRASPPSSNPDLITGRLVQHGRAPFQHDRHQPMSYFVKIETGQGERVVWGVDLERAMGESVTKPQAGDEIGLRAVRKDAVTVKAAKRDQTGKVIGEQDLDALRNRWVVEKRAFFDARSGAAEKVRDRNVQAREAVKEHPELVGTYLQIRAAELAAKKMKDPDDRTRFVSAVRTALADAVAQGEPAPRVRMRDRKPSRPPTKTRGPRTADQAPVRG